MKIVLLDTAIMVGITFVVGFAVAALIYFIVKMLLYSQEHSFKEALKMWRHHLRINKLKELRVEALSEKEEDKYELCHYELSHNLKGKKANKNPEGFTDYPISPNRKGKRGKKDSRGFKDYPISYNNHK